MRNTTSKRKNLIRRNNITSATELIVDTESHGGHLEFGGLYAVLVVFSNPMTRPVMFYLEGCRPWSCSSSYAYESVEPEDFHRLHAWLFANSAGPVEEFIVIDCLSVPVLGSQ